MKPGDPEFDRIAATLPTLEEVTADPVAAKIPDSPQSRYAFVMYLAYKVTPENIEAIRTYAGRMHPDAIKMLEGICAISAACSSPS